MNFEAFFAGCGFGIVIVFLQVIFLQIFIRIFLWVFFWIGEVFVFPDIFAEQGLVHAARVDDDFVLEAWLEVGVTEIEGCGLQSVEHEAGGFGVELAAECEAHHLHESDLDGLSVLEDGKVEGGSVSSGAGGVDDDALIVPLLMKVAEALVA